MWRSQIHPCFTIECQFEAGALFDDGWFESVARESLRYSFTDPLLGLRPIEILVWPNARLGVDSWCHFTHVTKSKIHHSRSIILLVMVRVGGQIFFFRNLSPMQKVGF